MKKDSFDSKIKYLETNDNIPSYIVDYLTSLYTSIHSKPFIWFARALMQLTKNASPESPYTSSMEIPQYISISPDIEISKFKSDIDNDEIQLNEYTKAEDIDISRKEELEKRINKNKILLSKLESFYMTAHPQTAKIALSLLDCYKYVEDHYLMERKKGYDLSGYSLGLAYMNSVVWHEELAKTPKEKKKKEVEENAGNILFKFDDYYVVELLEPKDFSNESDEMANCIRGYSDKASTTHRFFAMKSMKDFHSVIDAEFDNGKFVQIKGWNNKDIKLEYQFAFLNFIYFLCNYDQEKIDLALEESDDYIKWGEHETLPNGENQYYFMYKGGKYILDKFVEVTDPQ